MYRTIYECGGHKCGLAKEVMGRMDVVGESIKLDGVEYLIVGVQAADESDSSTTENYEAYIPYTSLIRLTDSVSGGVIHSASPPQARILWRMRRRCLNV